MKVTHSIVKNSVFEHIKPGECFITINNTVFIKTQNIYTKDGDIYNAVNLETGSYYTFANRQLVVKKPNANLIIGD